MAVDATDLRLIEITLMQIGVRDILSRKAENNIAPVGEKPNGVGVGNIISGRASF